MSKVICFLLAFYGCLSSFYAQPIRVDVTTNNVVHLEHNHLSLPGGDTIMKSFFQKLTDLMLYGNKQIHVLHIGGSHVQADIFSNRLRGHLATFLPNFMSSRGLIFPFSMIKTNNPANYKVNYSGKWTGIRNVNKSFEYPLGLAGIAAYTFDSNATLHINFDNKYNIEHDFTSLRVLHHVDSSSYNLMWLGESHAEVEKDEWGTVFYFDKPQKEINLSLNKHDALQNSFVLLGLLLDSERPGISYSAVGVNGASTWSYLKCKMFETQLGLVVPDMVIFAIGINDAHDANFSEQNFYKNYEKLIEQFKVANPNTFFVFITNNDSYGYNKKLNTNATVVRKVMFELAEKYNGAVWDLFSIMGGLQSSTKWRDIGLMAKDRIHFSREGYNLLGDLLFNAVMQSFEDHLKNTSLD
jgi:hypothetical protein